ncbi:hypothetical protein [Polyangium spumosum]|uniref:Lipoprotein n=1 Tax=Polyangium spumosum TaxID=889282 RepID=A0A6N7PQ66_9BACT|nr:hypothetical protein [Polyangium spumosum]MRG94352.1 hypothetical protein [Polyangium spumosum]
MKKMFGFLLAAGLLGSACRSEPAAPEIEYGEPVGLRMATKRGMPDYEIAVAVTKGTNIDPLVPVLGAALHAAVELCPDVVEAGRRGEALDVAFRVEQGVIRDPAAKGDAATCVARALGGKAIAAPDKLSVLAQIRFPVEAPAP